VATSDKHLAMITICAVNNPYFASILASILAVSLHYSNCAAVELEQRIVLPLSCASWLVRIYNTFIYVYFQVIEITERI